MGLALHPASLGPANWWTAFTHPLVHVSLYHLLLDAGAFLCLYGMLSHWSPSRRLLVVGACAAGSLGAACMSPVFRQQGLCGLSGIAHGLMAVVCLDLARRADSRVVGIAGLAIVVAKCAAEALSGTVVFSSLHAGHIGRPVVLCHAGGVLGGLLAVPPLRGIAAIAATGERLAAVARGRGGSEEKVPVGLRQPTTHAARKRRQWLRHGSPSPQASRMRVLMRSTPHGFAMRR